MRTNMWTVIVVVVAWIGFLLGYALSSHSGSKGHAVDAPAVKATAGPSAGGYGR